MHTFSSKKKKNSDKFPPKLDRGGQEIKVTINLNAPKSISKHEYKPQRLALYFSLFAYLSFYNALSSIKSKQRQPRINGFNLETILSCLASLFRSPISLVCDFNFRSQYISVQKLCKPNIYN